MKSIRYTLNAANKKVVVATRNPDSCSHVDDKVQIWKQGELQDEFNILEFCDFYFQRKWLCPKITAFLQEEAPGLRGQFERFPSHLIHYTYLRDKPFILIERDDIFEEVRGVPGFRQTYLGLTAWKALCALTPTLIAFFPPDETD